MSPIGAASIAAAAVTSLVAAASGAWARPSRHPRAAVAARPEVPSSVRACCDALDVPVDPGRIWQVARIAGVLVPLLLFVAMGPVAAVAVPIGCLFVPRALLPTLERRRSMRRDAQLAPGLERMASAVRAGRSLRVALSEVAASSPRPLADDLTLLSQSLDHGATLDDAVARWAGRPDASPDVRLAAAAIGLGGRAGGEVARAIDGVAATLRERRELQGEAIALATQARASAAVLVFAPLGFAGLVASIQPATLRFLLGTPVGLGCLGLGLALDVLGASWMARIVRQAV